MPRPASASSSDGLPLWDTFEALFFFVAGLSAGVVLGILLPSLWRTLRRRFRNVEKVAPLDDRLLADVSPPVAILRTDTGPDGSPDPNGDVDDAGEEGLPRVKVAEAFVYARFLLQEGKAREAIRVYLELLKSDAISKGQTNRALFELAQCYVSVGLEVRALDTFLELHHRKPKRPQVLQRILPLCVATKNEGRLLATLSTYGGPRPEALQEAAAAALCHFASEAWDEGKSSRALDLARVSLRWRARDPHGQALVWRITGEEIWRSSREMESADSLWSALAADLDARLQIGLDTGLSPAAECSVLAERLAHLAALPDAFDAFRSLRREFRETSGALRREGKPREERDFDVIVVYGFLQLFRYERMAGDGAVASLVPLLLPQPAAAFVEHCRSLVEHAGPELPYPLAALFHHLCRRCHAQSGAFQWTCSHCGGQGTFAPVTLPSWTVTQPATPT